MNIFSCVLLSLSVILVAEICHVHRFKIQKNKSYCVSSHAAKHPRLFRFPEEEEEEGGVCYNRV